MVDFNINKFKKQTLFAPNIKNDLTSPITREGIEHIIPHKDPFLLLDTIEILNLEQRFIKATRWIDPQDPIFAGHFPDNPIYPGVLQQEIMFQGCLALLYFISHNTTQVLATHPAINAVGTRAHDVHNLSAVRPNETLSIYCHISEYDELLTTNIAQVCVENRVCCIGKGELYVT